MLFTEHWSEKTKEGDVGWMCSTRGENEKYVHKLGRKAQRKCQIGNRDVNGRLRSQGMWEDVG